METNQLRELLLSYRRINRLYQGLLDDVALKNDITGMQLYAGHLLKQTPGITLQELADQLRVSKSTCSGIIDRMAKAGLVIRQQNAENRRAVKLSMTELGLQKTTDTYAVFIKVMEILNELGDEKLTKLIDSNQQVIQILETERMEMNEQNKKTE